MKNYPKSSKNQDLKFVSDHSHMTNESNCNIAMIEHLFRSDYSHMTNKCCKQHCDDRTSYIKLQNSDNITSNDTQKGLAFDLNILKNKIESN